MGGQGLQLGQVGVIEAGGLIRVTPNRRVHLGELLGSLERGPARGAGGAHGEHSVDARLGRRGDQICVRRLAEIKVGMAVDHRLTV